MADQNWIDRFTQYLQGNQPKQPNIPPQGSFNYGPPQPPPAIRFGQNLVRPTPETPEQQEERIKGVQDMLSESQPQAKSIDPSSLASQGSSDFEPPSESSWQNMRRRTTDPTKDLSPYLERDAPSRPWSTLDSLLLGGTLGMTPTTLGKALVLGSTAASKAGYWDKAADWVHEKSGGLIPHWLPEHGFNVLTGLGGGAAAEAEGALAPHEHGTRFKLQHAKELVKQLRDATGGETAFTLASPSTPTSEEPDTSEGGEAHDTHELNPIKPSMNPIVHGLPTEKIRNIYDLLYSMGKKPIVM